jgi:ribosome biogenesis GTPase A
MDMYQKRKIRQEKKLDNNIQNNGVEKNNINWYPGHMAKTKRLIKERINLIDIIYEVIDARMPITSKMKDIDDILKNKPRIVIMTKKDLCDLEITKKWVKFYENNGNKCILMDLTNNVDYKKLIQVTKEMMEPINERRKSQGLKEKEIKIGVVGIPNVGKSTLINKLAGKKVANVENKPGVTKQVNWLKTSHGFLMLDTPGILWPKLTDNDEALKLAATATINANILNMTDIGGYLIAFYKKYYPNILESYHISSDLEVLEAFYEIAKKQNFIKNDEVDYEKVSLKLYNDLTSGKIRGVTFDRYES